MANHPTYSLRPAFLKPCLQGIFVQRRPIPQLRQLFVGIPILNIFRSDLRPLSTIEAEGQEDDCRGDTTEYRDSHSHAIACRISRSFTIEEDIYRSANEFRFQSCLIQLTRSDNTTRIPDSKHERYTHSSLSWSGKAVCGPGIDTWTEWIDTEMSEANSEVSRSNDLSNTRSKRKDNSHSNYRDGE